MKPIIAEGRNFKFEVAFSFLKEEESLAYILNDFIQDRLDTFLYSQKQKELVGKDGIDAFTKVFKDESRIVVVLYREGWGKTPWTRIEERAIKERGMDESFDFLVIISLDGTWPNWLSKYQIWYDLNRFGIKSAAAIIEERVKHYGGDVRDESIADFAARQKREINRIKEIDDYLKSPQANKDATEEIKSLFEYGDSVIKNNASDQTTVYFVPWKEPNSFSCIGEGYGLTFKWQQPYTNSIYNASLVVSIRDKGSYGSPIFTPTIFEESEYVFFLGDSGTKGWVKIDDKSDFKTTPSLVDFWLKKVFSRTQVIRVKREKEKAGF